MRRLRARVAWLVTISLCATQPLYYLSPVQAQSVDTFRLSVKPENCTALHKGQTCFQSVVFHWSLPTAAEYCLHKTGTQDPLLCWIGMSISSFSYQFAASSSEHFEIHYKGEKNSLAQVDVQTFWVYRGGRRSSSRWRLF
jgi:hypothetical protein